MQRRGCILPLSIYIYYRKFLLKGDESMEEAMLFAMGALAALAVNDMVG